MYLTEIVCFDFRTDVRVDTHFLTTSKIMKRITSCVLLSTFHRALQTKLQTTNYKRYKKF